MQSSAALTSFRRSPLESCVICNQLADLVSWTVLVYSAEKIDLYVNIFELFSDPVSKVRAPQTRSAITSI